MRLKCVSKLTYNGGNFIVVGKGSLKLRVEAVDRLLGDLSFYELKSGGVLEPCADGGNSNKTYALPLTMFERFNLAQRPRSATCGKHQTGLNT